MSIEQIKEKFLKYTVVCPECEKEAPWVENKEKYGRNYGDSYMCYYCKECKTYVGCHNNTRQPLGTMATVELQEWRKKVHAYIDPMWRSGKVSRSKLYYRISKILGCSYHTGEADIDMCKKVLAIKNFNL